MSVIIDTSCDNCVWVNAGVLNYKLCDRAFECEQCPLDAALRDHASGYLDDDATLTETMIAFPDWEQLPAESRPLLEPFHAIPLCSNARYSAHHIWVRLLGSGMVRMGLDSFAAALLPDDAQLVTVAHKTQLREGEAFGWVYAWNRTLPLPSPVAGNVVCRNGGRVETIGKVRENPYRAGSLLSISPAAGALATARVYSPTTHSKRIQRNCRSIAARVARAMPKSELGVCLNDGGQPVISLEQMFGTERYWKLVTRLIAGD
jgi:glycine cleavage system H protein